MFFFFFSSRRRHTRLTCDWSSDVCSSDLEAAIRAGIGHDLGARYPVGIKLIVPRRVERVCPVDPAAIAADLHHLGTTGIRLAAGMRRAPRNAADVNRPGKLWLSRVSDVVLTHLAGPPAGDIKEPIIHGEINVGD